MTTPVSVARLEVLHAGPHITVQDGGRSGLKRYGVPASGPMDRKSFAIANAVLGNPVDHAAIEVSVAGLSLRCTEGAITVAVAGGGFVLQAGTRRLGSWSVLTLRAGDTLNIQAGVWGIWCYLALAGDLQVPAWLGSQSTHASSGLGGGAVRTGQTLMVQRPRVNAVPEGDMACPVWARPARTVQCVLGPQDRFLRRRRWPSSPKRATNSPTPTTAWGAAARTGTAAGGCTVHPSEPIVRGSVQVSGDGAPTVLLADHQTTGGYPKIATLLADEVDRLVQCRPPDAVRFVPVTPEQAIAQRRFWAQQQQTYLQRLLADFGFTPRVVQS